MAVRGRDIVHWHVWFYGNPRCWWEKLLFKPGFRHCIAFAWIETDRWLVIDPSFDRQQMRILTGPQHEQFQRVLVRAGGSMLSFDVQGGSRLTPRVATCAGALAHVLGVRGALLPHGLYRALRDHPAAVARA